MGQKQNQTVNHKRHRQQPRAIFPLCEHQVSVRFDPDALALGGQLPAGTDHHQNHPTHQKSQHSNHEENTPREARADAAHARGPRNAGRLLTPLTSNQRRRIIHQQRSEQRKQPEHALSLSDLPARRKSVPIFFPLKAPAAASFGT